MNIHLIAAIFLLGIGFSAAVFNCPGVGNYPGPGDSCKMYYECDDYGTAREEYCQGELLVYNRIARRCTRFNETTVQEPCNIFVSCRNKAAGVYAYMPTQCRHYYTCQIRGVFMGAIACTPGTVYDERPYIATCNYPDHTPPPCGTYTGPPTTPWSLTTPFPG